MKSTAEADEFHYTTDMAQHENRFPDSLLSNRTKRGTPLADTEIAVRLPALDEAAAAIARELIGPLTALLLYMGEIKLHSLQFSQAAEDRAYLQKVIENAIQQTERICALVEQLAGSHREAAGASNRKGGAGDRVGAPHTARASAPGQRPLTRREREVLKLISEGYTNKQGALRMRISPRTFESHRAEVMRKLGARNTADLVRAALRYPEV
jgi:DNA-binding CsgD family transcriptional regulator